MRKSKTYAYILTTKGYRLFDKAYINARMLGPRFHLILHSYDCNMHVEGLLPANVCLVTSLTSEQCLQFERFRMQHIQVVNKRSNFKTKLIGNNANISAINRSTFGV